MAEGTDMHREEIAAMERSVEELERDLAAERERAEKAEHAVQNAIDLLGSGACDKHLSEIQGMDFTTYKLREDEWGCHYCWWDRADAAEQRAIAAEATLARAMRVDEGTVQEIISMANKLVGVHSLFDRLLRHVIEQGKRVDAAEQQLAAERERAEQAERYVAELKATHRHLLTEQQGLLDAEIDLVKRLTGQLLDAKQAKAQAEAACAAMRHFISELKANHSLSTDWFDDIDAALAGPAGRELLAAAEAVQDSLDELLSTEPAWTHRAKRARERLARWSAVRG